MCVVATHMLLLLPLFLGFRPFFGGTPFSLKKRVDRVAKNCTGRADQRQPESESRSPANRSGKTSRREERQRRTDARRPAPAGRDGRKEPPQQRGTSSSSGPGTDGRERPKGANGRPAPVKRRDRPRPQGARTAGPTTSEETRMLFPGLRSYGRDTVFCGSSVSGCCE